MEGLATAARTGVTAFVAEFMDSTGARCHGLLTEVWATPFERAAPVRSFPSFRGQVNFTGLYYAPSLNKVLKDFERDRLITVRYAAVDVLDPARLTRLAT